MDNLKGSIKTLFVIGIVVLTTILLSILTLMNVFQFMDATDFQVRESLQNKAGEIRGRLDQRILQVEEKALGLALAVSGSKNYDQDALFSWATGYIKSDSLVYGSGFWLEPNEFQQGMQYYGPYLYNENGTVKLTMDYSNAEYNYFSKPYYTLAKNSSGGVAWESPYKDDVSGVTMMSSSCAIKKNGRFVGVVTVDVSIKELEDYIREIKVGQTGYAFLVSNEGYYLGTKDESKNMQKKITEEGNSELSTFGGKVLGASEISVEESDIFGEDSYVLISPLVTDNLKLVIVAPKSDYMGAVHTAVYQSIGMSLLVMIILCAGMMFIFNRRIGSPIENLMREADKIAKGDLRGDVQVESDDEIGALAHSLKNMSDNLKTVIRSVGGMSEQVAAASEELTASSEQSAQASNQVANSIVMIAENSSQQAVEAQNIQGTAENMSHHSTDIAENTRAVAQNAKNARENVISGRSAISEAVTQMQNITDSTESIQASIKKLSDSGKQIGEIVGMITSIAEQTNLLALNAAIEAARAGEAGRGFAVVADEVRKLAEQSNNSSQQIVELVKSNNTDMEQAISASQLGAESVKKGIATVQSADEVFQNIVDIIDKLVEDVNSISAAIQRMANESEEMLSASVNISNNSIKNSDEAQTVSAATQQQTASVHEISDASRSLADLAGNLQAEISKFKF